MKAIRLLQTARPLALVEVPTPEAGPLDVVIQVKAAGICHSDAHYRSGTSPAFPLPLTLGHEVAGVVDTVGASVDWLNAGDRVCLHYLVTCGHCAACLRGNEQFCRAAAMIGKHRDGGYAERIVIPARSVVRLPETVPFEHGAILMCSSATALHALRKARLQPGEAVVVFGAGGLGLSAIQLAQCLGAGIVIAVDINPGNLKLAAGFGAIALDASSQNAVSIVLELTGGAGANVTLDFVGAVGTMRQSVQCLAVQGRAAFAGISRESLHVTPYDELINKEAELIGVSDHLAQELPLLIELARSGRLDLSHVVRRTIPLDAEAVNNTLDQLDRAAGEGRVVIKV